MTETNRVPEVNQNLPRVTDILASAGLVDTTWFTPETRTRGSVVHMACQYLDEGDLDESTVDAEIVSYVIAYDKWRKDWWGSENFQWIECPKQDKLGLYRGTPDRILTTRPRWLWDIKTGCSFPWHTIQTAAYVNMLDDPYSYRRGAVYLKPDGTYRVEEFPRETYQTDLAVFMAALTLLRWKENHNGKRS